MDPVTQAVLQNVMQIALIAFAIGVGVFSLARSTRPEIDFSQGGNVWTGPLQIGDLVVTCLFFALFFITLRGPALAVDDEATKSAISSPSIILGSMLMLALAGFLVLIVVGRGISAVEFFGLDRLKPWHTIVWAVLGCVVCFAAVIPVSIIWLSEFITPVFGEPKMQDMIIFYRETATPVDRLIIVISACLIAPLAEEVIFRGYLYPVLKRFTEPVFAAIIVSVIFAIIHHNVAALAPLATLSILLIISYELTASLWVPIAIHSLFNGVNLLNT